MCITESGQQGADNPPPVADGGANSSHAEPSLKVMTCAIGSTLRADGRTGSAPDTSVAKEGYGWVVRIIESEGPAILRLLWRILGSEADVMDAYQDCFCKLAARKSEKDLRSAKAYAYRTATNIAIELIRTRSRRRAHFPRVAAQRVRELSGEPAEGADEGRLTALRDAIGRLPAHLANVVVLRDLSRLSYEEVGRTLGIEPATARVYRRHAVVKLAELLGEGEES